MLTSLLIHQDPLPSGTPAPSISLTAHDGAWFRTKDHVGSRAVVLVFFGEARGEAGRMLKAFDAVHDQIRDLGATLRGVCHQRPEHLDTIHQELGLSFGLLYDLGAVASRTWHQSRRRPLVREGVAVIDQQGLVAWHEHGAVDPTRILDALHTLRDQLDQGDLQRILWAEAEELVSQGWALVDLRTPAEFEGLHHPSARSVPMDDLPGAQAQLASLPGVVCVCATGEDSQAAASMLQGAGLQARWIRRGMRSWVG